MNSLIPVRLDLEHKSTRLVETLLVDPDLPPDVTSIVTDLQVLGATQPSSQGASATYNSSARLDLDLPKLILQAQAQLNAQIAAFRKQVPQETSNKRSRPVEQVETNVTNDNDATQPPAKKQKTSETLSQPGALEPKHQDETSTKSSLVPITLEMSIQGTRIQDSFMLDPALNMNVLDFAKTISDDLKLGVEAITPIAIAIAEQLLVPRTTRTSQIDPDEKPPELTDVTTAAWKIPTGLQATHTVHLVSHNRAGLPKPTV